jgi:hypothetical protein
MDSISWNTTMRLQSPKECFQYFHENGFYCKPSKNEEKLGNKASWTLIEEFKTINEIKEKYPEYFI